MYVCESAGVCAYVCVCADVRVYTQQLLLLQHAAQLLGPLAAVNTEVCIAFNNGHIFPHISNCLGCIDVLFAVMRKDTLILKQDE